MRALILVKHSLPALEPEIPSARWRLAPEGRQRCLVLAARLAPYRPAVLFTSVEPKASQTAQIVAERLGVPWAVRDGLHEHERDNAGFLGAAAFRDAVARLFAQPDDLVFGVETAAAAQTRFTQAVRRVLDEQHTGNIAIVAHGTVIALFAHAHAGADPFSLWQRLDLPSFVVFSLPDMRLMDVIDGIG
jgi:broad specificity phosphatase PhoE